MSGALQLHDLTVRYGTGVHALTAVDGVSLNVAAGEVLGIVGESGSGKSSLARAAVGLVPVRRGQILLDGVPPPRRGRRALQMVFQDPFSSLDPRMTVARSIAETIPRTVAKSERASTVHRMLELVNLTDEQGRALPGQLSGGQRQRVAIARALAGRPDVLIADEITSALDVSVQGAILNLIRDLQRELGMSMLFISHNLAVVRYVASRIAVMYLGQIVECGPAEEVLADPQHPYTRDLLDAIPTLDPTGATHSAVTVAAAVSTEPPDPHYPPTGCRYHPRCPIGPAVRSDRSRCAVEVPTVEHRHGAMCHFAASVTDLPLLSFRRGATSC